MKHINVVFVIGNDIVRKLRKKPQAERMPFVLGHTDNDYFGKHYHTIEELNDDCEDIFQYFEISEDISLNIRRHGCNLNPPDDDCMLLLVEHEYTKEIFHRLNRISPIQIKQHYLNMVNHFEDSGISFDDFNFYIECFKSVTQEAIRIKGTLLFSLEPYHIVPKACMQ